MNSNESIDELLIKIEFLRQLFGSMFEKIQNIEPIKEKLHFVKNKCNCNAFEENDINSIEQLFTDCLIDNSFESYIKIFTDINKKLNKLKDNNNEKASNCEKVSDNERKTQITINNFINSRKLRAIKPRFRFKKDIFEENIKEEIDDKNKIMIKTVYKSKLKSRRGRPRKEEWERIALEKKTRALFVCSWTGCDKRFLFNSHLVNHFRVHTGEKPFSCDWVGCGKSFHTNAVLMNHQKTYHEKKSLQNSKKTKPYKCLYPECDSRYQRRDQLERHTSAVHTGEKPLRCDWPGCDFETVCLLFINRYFIEIDFNLN